MEVAIDGTRQRCTNLRIMGTRHSQFGNFYRFCLQFLQTADKDRLAQIKASAPAHVPYLNPCRQCSLVFARIFFFDSKRTAEGTRDNWKGIFLCLS